MNVVIKVLNIASILASAITDQFSHAITDAVLPISNDCSFTKFKQALAKNTVQINDQIQATIIAVVSKSGSVTTIVTNAIADHELRRTMYGHLFMNGCILVTSTMLAFVSKNKS